MGFTIWDGLVIVFYLIAVAVFGIWSAGKQNTTTDYFPRRPGHAVVGHPLFGGRHGNQHAYLYQHPRRSLWRESHLFQLTFGYIIGRVIVAIWFLPAYVQGELTTAYQFLEKRFGAGMRKAASSTFIVTRLAG